MDLHSVLPMLLGLAWVAPLASFVLIVFLGPRMGKAGVAAGHVATLAIVTSFALSFLAMCLWFGHHPPAAAHHDDHHEAAPHAEHHASATPLALTPVSLNLADEPAKKADEPAKKSETKAPAKSEAPADKSEPAKAETPAKAEEPAKAEAEPAKAEEPAEQHEPEAHAGPVAPIAGSWYSLAKFGNSSIDIGYYIDSLTVLMFVMVSLIASCIHFYAMGYMHDELHDITDKEVRLANGKNLHRPGRFYRFFQYLSLFCFSMFGVVIAGNIAMVFVFWELVGICSYFLIGFYYERHSASTAANKAFIVNRVGDFGMIIGLMALWGALGTFNFGDYEGTTADGKTETRPGLFSLVRPGEDRALVVPDGMVIAAAADRVTAGETIEENLETWRSEHLGYGLLIVAGLGIFCGCVGKSAQFPLHVWLPDAMEGPTPVSALVHSATMVAAGVYLVGRFYPVFTPEVLLTIAYIGGITLFIAATIAITATDIKRVLAYSTVSQLGYMMLALGLGGWLAGVFHLITHAFFKSLLFMCSGSVIHACHTNDMTKMGGLRHKMPWTAYTMLIGCLAIAGAGVPLMDIGFSGYYSKDAIITQALEFRDANPSHFFLFLAPVVGAAITAFYMFRLWYMTFSGTPRDAEIHSHVHESPPIMYIPLVVLSVFAVCVGFSIPFLVAGIAIACFFMVQVWFDQNAAAPAHDAHGHDSHGHDSHGHDSHAHHTQDDHAHDSHAAPGPIKIRWIPLLVFSAAALLLAATLPWHNFSVTNMLEQTRPYTGAQTSLYGEAVIPAEGHRFHTMASLVAFSTAALGFVLATLFYGLGTMNPMDVRRQFSSVYQFLWDKWRFDELYQVLFVRPVHVVSGWLANLDKKIIDRGLDGLAQGTLAVSRLDDRIDRGWVDGFFTKLADCAWSTALWLRGAQTGRLRQYVVFLAVGTVGLFVLITLLWNFAVAGH